MSLQVEDHRRTRSRSPGGSRRDRSRSRSRGPHLVIETDPYGGREGERERTYEHEELRYQAPLSPNQDAYYRRPRSPAVENTARMSFGDARYDGDYRRDSPRERLPDSDRERDRDRSRPSLMDAFLPQKYAKKLENSDAFNYMTAPISDKSRERSRDRRAEKKEKLDEDLAYGKFHSPPTKDARPVSPRPAVSPRHSPSPSPSYDYGKPPQWEYERDDRLSYSRDPRYSSDALGVGHGHGHGHGPSSRARSRSPAPGHRDGDRERRSHPHRDSLTADPRGSSANVGTVEPGDAPLKSAMKRPSSPQPPVNTMSSLSVSTQYHPGAGGLSVSAAPASPLLESYHGTYQQSSPMPSPLLLPTHFHPGEAQLMDISPVGSDDERSGKRRSRRARFADPQDDAQRLADALKGSKPPRTEPLIEILPGMTHEQVMNLRAEYKRLVKTGPERKGVNVAKHIRVRLKDEDPSLMKACYATALGRWESEAYWSSFWYQGDKTRRELLIESLMGRTNDEIHEIKDSFTDKKYGDSLTRCMKLELKEDKFKKAVLMVLDEQRMDDFDRHGRPLELDYDLVRSDVHTLHKAVKAEKGGESAMIGIVVMRSDSHLREILRVYSDEYRANFARDALKKSGNLVGELLAHILNGVINKPVRDALLVHHALTASKKDGLRRELLTSRLVRFHWDRLHLSAIKRAYFERYGKDMMEAVRDGTSGEWGQFCQELCISRMPDDVKRVERIQMSR
ncbi:annexin ANXC4 [Diaporthe helianthi]|uniref:Annexin ANXC4 n=1 Tax=Diaporthe helianthi TaxID=158607 RepID=A0A2P5I381_DIAHE|nr:annexin ANXC4 [Diaporthe helianthi]